MKCNSSMSLFHPFAGLGVRKLILFGAGKYADDYLDKFSNQYRPEFIVDNDKEKWGTAKRGIEIKSPDEIRRLAPGTYRIVITIAHFQSVIDQLHAMGIDEDSYRIYDKKVVELLPLALTDTLSEGKYHVGYVTGAFDLFHIGHLNLLRRCKERSHYLIAGVLTDEIIQDEKYKTPFIPFEERIEIVKQCKYVDRAIPVDKHNTNKLDAWKELRFGCLFSGSDHEYEPYWITLRQQLRALGSELEFFPYTQSTSSTMLQKVLKKYLEV